jgi:hypothetical protein
MVLDVHGGSGEAGAALELFPPHGGENQNFTFEVLPGGGWGVLRAAGSGLAADVERDGRSPGARVLMFPFHGGANQLFKFERARGGKGYGRLRGKASRLVLAAAAAAQPGAALVLAEDAGDDDAAAQLFHVG